MTLTSHRLPERYVKALERRMAGEIIPLETMLTMRPVAFGTA
jgi:hypothetical protein